MITRPALYPSFPALLKLLSVLLIFLSPLSQAQQWEWAPDFQTGDKLPPIQAVDQNGDMRTLADLVGPNGVVLVFSRSFDWCPFCISQLNNLVKVAGEFSDLGLGIATMTYDPVSTLKAAEEDYATSFPLLHDEETRHFSAMGILNKEYEPGDRAYGIPEPGIMLVDEDGIIRFKFAEESYRIRPDFAEVLAAAATM